MYGVTKQTEDLSTSGSNVLNPGIHENISVLVEFKKLKEDSQNELLMVTYRNTKGEEIRDILWPIDDQKEIERNRNNRLDLKYPMTVANLKTGEPLVIPAGPLADEHVLPRAYHEFGQKIFHIGKAIIGEERASKLTGNTYAQFGANMARECANNGALCRLKVVLNYKDYSSTPRYGAFLENMADVPQTKLKIVPSDKMERTVPDAGTSAPSSMPPGGMPDMPPAPDVQGMPEMPELPEMPS